VLDRTLLTDWLAYFASSGRRITHVWCESLALPFQAGTWTLSLRAPEQGGGALLRLSQDTVLSLSDPIEANQALLAHALLSQPKPSAIHAYGDAQALAPFEAWLRPLAVAPTRLGADGLNAFIEAPGSHPSIELLQGEFAFGLSLAEWRQWRVAIALALAALLIHTVGLSVRASQLAADKRELIAQQAATLKHAFPDTTVVLDAPAQMRRALGALQQHIGQSNASDFETLLGHAGQLLSSLPANACSEMHFDEHALSLHLKAPSLTSSAAQSTLVRAAAALGESATLTTAGGNEGDLTLRLAPKGGA
jgi:general secretion pathway protein L